MFKFLLILFFASSVYCEGFCSRQNNSCSFMFGREYPDDFCWKVYYDISNQSVCDLYYDRNAVRRNTKSYGKLLLNPFYNTSDTRTKFNISFVDITFRKLKIRFEEYNFINGSTRKYEKEGCMVKDFILNGSVPADKTFSYDCAWRDANFEGHYLDFHYEYGVTEYETRRKYRFWVPEHDYLDDKSKKVYFFTYMDYSDTNNLILNIVPAHKRFNVTQYKIEVIYIDQLESSNITTKTNAPKIKYDTLAADNNDVLEYSYYTSGTVGVYYFRVEPVSNYCQYYENVCDKQETPRIEIREVEGSSTLLIGMVGVSLLIPIFMIILYMWRPRYVQKPVNVLLVTVPTNDAHDFVAPAFAKFLQETYHVNVMLDIDDVPRTFTRNSFDWLKLAIENATHIIFLRSNDVLPVNRVIYQDTYDQTMHLLNPKSTPIRKKECIIFFSYSVKENTPLELVHIKNRFDFKHPCSKLMHFLYKKKVMLDKTDNSAYLNLLAAINSVPNEKPEKNISPNEFEPIIDPSDDENEDHIDEVQSQQRDLLRDNDSVNVQVEDDLGINVLGEFEQINNANDENHSDSDSDFDESKMYGFTVHV